MRAERSEERGATKPEASVARFATSMIVAKAFMVVVCVVRQRGWGVQGGVYVANRIGNATDLTRLNGLNSNGSGGRGHNKVTDARCFYL